MTTKPDNADGSAADREGAERLPMPVRVSGRPTVLDNVAIISVETMVGRGITREDAAEVIGVDYSTFYRWVRRGEAAELEVEQHWAECDDENCGTHWEHPEPKANLYRRFKNAVIYGSALARSNATQWLYANDKRFWATHSPEARQQENRPGLHGFENTGTNVNVQVGLVTVNSIMSGARQTLSASGKLPTLAEVVAEAEINDVPSWEDKAAHQSLNGAAQQHKSATDDASSSS